MFDKNIYEMIIQFWVSDQNHPHRSREKKDLPTTDNIKKLTDTVFQASLKTEEQQFQKFSIVFFNENELNENKGNILEFEDKMDFDVENLSKLSTSTDPRNSAIVINKINNNYFIHGILFFHSPLNVFDDIPHHFEHLNNSKPDSIILTVEKPANIIYFRGTNQICRFFNGQIEISKPIPLHSGAMGNYIRDILKKNNSDKDIQWGIFSRGLDYLLKNTSKISKGASIVFVPDNIKIIENKTDYFDSIKTFKDDNVLKFDRIIDYLNWPSEHKEHTHDISLHKHLRERLNFLSTLACSDGALILTHSLKLIGFSAKLKAKKWEGNLELGPDGEGGGKTPYDLTKFGTRHNSMLNFIGANEDFLGFVISEDGPVRCFYKVDDELIYMWPDWNNSRFDH